MAWLSCSTCRKPRSWDTTSVSWSPTLTQLPTEVTKLVLMDAFLPGVEGWEAVYNDPSIWHFRFNGPTPEALVQGRERTYFDYFWNDLAADRTRSIPEEARQAYVAAYARSGRMHAGWAYFV